VTRATPSKRSRAVLSAVKLLQEISPPLHRDLLADIDDVVTDIKKSHVGEPPLADFDDHLKAGIRSLFGHIEATTWCFTAAVLQHFASDPSLANSDRAVLEERDYDAPTDTISSRSRRYSLSRRFEVSSRVFLQACGGQPPPLWDAETSAQFQALTRARNGLTHPARIEDLIVTSAFGPFRHIAAWFPLQVIHILAPAADVLGLARPTIPTPVVFPPLNTPMPQPQDVFDEEFYKRVFSEPAVAIRYIAFFSEKIDDELRRALDSCRAAMSPPYSPATIGRSVRRMIRAVTTNVEGTIGFTSFFMRAVRFSGGKVSIPQPPKGESVPDRIIRVLTAFSKAFGNDVTPTRSTAWDSLVSTFEIRDRLTHPRALRDIDLTIAELDPPMKALDWLWGPAHEAVLLDPDKIARTFGAR
jgi:hypothetical protein